jgi:hypothetical protein
LSLLKIDSVFLAIGKALLGVVLKFWHGIENIPLLDALQDSSCPSRKLVVAGIPVYAEL